MSRFAAYLPATDRHIEGCPSEEDYLAEETAWWQLYRKAYASGDRSTADFCRKQHAAFATILRMLEWAPRSAREVAA